MDTDPLNPRSPLTSRRPRRDRGYKVVACLQAQSYQRLVTNSQHPPRRDEESSPEVRDSEIPIPITDLRIKLAASYTQKLKMMSMRITICAAIVIVALISLSTALPASDKERFLNELDLVDDDGSVETALINYLFAKQVVNRLRSQMDVGDLQRKRSYWKQCAFNAVSCFGK